MDFFAGRVCLVTGASRGLGAELSRQLSSRGAKVVLFARSRAEMDALAQQFEAAHRDALVVVGDVSRPEDLERAATQAVARFGGIDVVIANAGIGVLGYVADCELDDFRRAMDVNFFGVLHAITSALPHLRKRRESRVAIVSSVGGKLSLPTSGAYSASKFALHGLADALRAEEAKHGVRVTVLCPGFFESQVRDAAIVRGLAPDAPPASLLLSTREVAEQSLAAIARGDGEVTISRFAKALLTVQKLAPSRVNEWLARASASIFERQRRPDVLSDKQRSK